MLLKHVCFLIRFYFIMLKVTVIFQNLRFHIYPILYQPQTNMISVAKSYFVMITHCHTNFRKHSIFAKLVTSSLGISFAPVVLLASKAKKKRSESGLWFQELVPDHSFPTISTDLHRHPLISSLCCL